MGQEPVEGWIRRVAEASESVLQQNGPHGWLLKQSIHTHYQRVLPLLSLPCFQALSGSILDVGAGTGALTLDLAWQAGNEALVTAIDSDTGALKIAQCIAERVGVRILTSAGDASAIPIKNASQDAAVARFLFQHLPDPLTVLLEMRRVTRSGGRILIIDVDDGAALSEPPETQPMAALRRAIRTLQSRRGGNRMIGRQLYWLMRKTGLKTIQVIVIPRVRVGVQNSAEMKAYQIERLLMDREELIHSGLMGAHDFDSAISEIERGFAEDRFEMDADFIATGVVPAGLPHGSVEANSD